MTSPLLQRLTNTQAIVGAAFAILLVAGQASDLLKPVSEPLLGPDYQPYVFPVLLVAAMALVLHALILAPRPQARLARPEVLRLRRDSRSHLVGRQDEIDSLIALATRSPLLFIDGESGVGKSALLGAGVAPQLAERGNLLPVYIESLAGPDWDDDAWRLLFLALQPMLSDEQRKAAALNGLPEPADRKRILESLRSATARTPLIIIDQFDDYQARHWGRFQNNGSWTKAAEIIERNSFWRALAELVGDGKVHLAVVTRSDTALGLESVRFGEPETYEVPRLSTEFIGQLLNSITSTASGEEAVIENPEAGWTALRDRLIDDLARAGAVLPQQLKIALLGLASLPRQLLSVAAYERVGRTAGLEAEWIRARIKRAEQAGGLDEAQTLALLLALIDPDKPRKTRELASGALAQEAGVEEAERDRLGRSLAQLEGDEIIRRRRDPDEASDRWRLDHDYLTGVVREAHRRADAWTARLKEGQEALAGAGRHWAGRWNALLKPATQLRFLWDRAKGRFRYGAYRGYAVRSGARFLPLTAVISVTLAGALYLDHEARTREFVERITTPFDERPELAEAEIIAVHELLLADPGTFDNVLERLLSTDSQILRLTANLPAIARAMRWYSDDSQGVEAANRILDAFQAARDDSAASDSLALALGQLGRSLTEEQRAAAAIPLIARVERALAGRTDGRGSQSSEEEARRLFRTYDALLPFADRLTREQSRGLIAALLARVLRRAENGAEIYGLAPMLANFGLRRPPDETRAIAGQIFSALGRARSPTLRGQLAEALGLMGERLSPGQAAAAGARIVEAMEQNVASTASSTSLGTALGRLADRVSPERIDRGAELIVASMREGNWNYHLIDLGEMVGQMGGRVSPRHGTEAARLILAYIEGPSVSDTTFGSFGACPSTSAYAQGMPAEEASALVSRLQARLRRTGANRVQTDIGRLLGSLGERLPPPVALATARHIVAAVMDPQNIMNEDGICVALAALARRAPAGEAAQMRERLERRLSREVRPAQAAKLTAAIIGLSARLPREHQAERIFRALADPLAETMTQGMLDRLAVVARAEFDQVQDAYRWIATEQQQGRFRSIDLQAIAGDMRATATTRLGVLRARPPGRGS